MFVERPPLLYRMLIAGAVWRIKGRGRKVYLTFDDGPIPEVTPWVLDTLEEYGIHATFFCVGDNVERHPELLDEIRRRGHMVGNHTMNHMQSLHASNVTYLRNVVKANRLIGSRLFRPPHGLIKHRAARAIKRHYTIIMHDLVSCDYNHKLSGEQVLNNVKRKARPGSIIVFHDSLKAEKNLKYALPKAIEWLKSNGYEFGRIDMF